MKLTWISDRPYSLGLDRGVFYPPSGPGEAWNGLSALTETPTVLEEQSRYVDGVRTRMRRRKGEFTGSIEAFAYPDSFYTDILLKRRPASFGLSYRTGAGDYYRVHLVYNVVVVPTTRTSRQRAIDPFTWNFTTTPIAVPEADISAHLIVDSSVAYPWTILALEEILYGTETTEPRLPTPQEVWDLVEENSLLLVVDHGDGTFSIIGPDDAITILSATTFEVTWPSVVNIDANTYQISSL